MKKLIALLLIAVLALSAAACSSQPADTQAPAEGTEAAAPADGAKVVKIGVFEPASGDNGAGGKQEVLGVEYANSLAPTVEIGGETYNVELVEVDNQSSTDKAVTAAQELVSKKVSIVLGSYGSGVQAAPARHGCQGHCDRHRRFYCRLPLPALWRSRLGFLRFAGKRRHYTL